MREGASVFATSCQGCHATTPAAAARRHRDDISAYRFTVGQIESFARVMPVHPPVRGRRLRAVAAYVAALQRAAAKGP